MEENTSMSKHNKLKKDYTNGWRATNKALGEFSWPPKSYSCGFCKREFRSAQALGGHMNVHRREKARLRQITPYLHPQFQHLSSNSNFFDSNPNPNPNIKTCFASNTSSVPKVFPPFTYSSCLPFSDDPCHRLCPPTSGNFYTLRSRESNLIGDGFDDFFDHDKAERMIVKKSKTDLFAELKFDHDLDLELRLGCS